MRTHHFYCLITLICLIILISHIPQLLLIRKIYCFHPGRHIFFKYAQHNHLRCPMMVEVSLERSVVRHTCSWRDKLIVLLKTMYKDCHRIKIIIQRALEHKQLLWLKTIIAWNRLKRKKAINKFEIFLIGNSISCKTTAKLRKKVDAKFCRNENSHLKWTPRQKDERKATVK